MNSNPTCWATKSISLQHQRNDPAKKETKIIKWFMFNEVPTTPLHPSKFLPEWQQSQEGVRDQSEKQRNNLMDVK